MIMKNFIYLLICLLGLCNTVFAQDEKELYAQGKKYFIEQRYDLACDVFGRLVAKDDHAFSESASFYLALSHYKADRKEKAKDLWLELAFLVPNWEKIEEVYFWLSAYYLEQENTVGRQRYLDKIGDAGILKDALALDKTPTDMNPHQDSSAREKSDSTWLSNFIISAQKNNYSAQEIASLLGVPNSTRKEQYKVAVLLPFMFESLADHEQTSKNKFVMDIYDGIKYGLAKLASEGINIEIYPYDTKKTEEVTLRILNKKEVQNMDLIVGPLYQHTTKLTAEYCAKNKIPQLNLLSTDLTSCKYPYSYYFKPSRSTIASKIFKYVRTQEQEDTLKKASIFYQKTPKDQQIAEAYKAILEANDYTIAMFMGLEKEEAQKIGEIIGEKVEIIIDSVEHKDSIELHHPEISIRTRKAYGEDGDEDYYETLVLKKEDIGHIMISSSSPSFGASIISALEIRDDSILTIGDQKWLNPRVNNIPQLARQNIILTNSYYVSNRVNYDAFVRGYVKKYKEYPDQNAIIGFESIYTFGKILHKYGRNFGPGLLTGDKITGNIYEGLKFDFHPDNQIVPIIKIINSQFIKVN